MINELVQIKLSLSYLPIINFSMSQNNVSVIRELSIQNITDNPLSNVIVKLNFDPDYANSVPIAIETIQTGETINIEINNLNLSANYLAQLTERIKGSIIIEILSEEKTLTKETFPIDILAYDQWAGLNVLPEMLSAFVTPNHPAIVPIIKRATLILEQWTGNPSLDEYQSRNPDRVQKQMAAIYTAIAEQQIIYSTIPASFEEYGQRVRLVDAVMNQKLGTCLDMALLYASCLEAIGLHAMIIITDGHAFAGAWLVPETFPDNVIDDISLISKRIADGINDITLVETTCMNMGKNFNFDQAIKIANSKINQHDFILAIDIKRSRFSAIKPIPQRILNGQHWEIQEEPPIIDKSQEYTPQTINPYDLSGISSEIVITKQLLWERKLLDLSLRNNLLNIRITKNTLQLISADIDLFEDALAEGDEFRILHKPTDWDNPLFNYGLYQSITGTDPIIDLIKSELTQKRLRSYLSENELSKSLTHLYRSSRTAMEENGANTLYIALGLLKWYETKASERPRYAPILLLPVEIIRKSAAKGYIIRSREEETMMNITLLEMLRQNFNINIGGLNPLPTDKSGVNVKLIYSIIRNSIKNQPKWDVEEQAILGLFSFNKFIMWNDIHSNAHKLIENKVVSSLMNGKIEWDLNEISVDAKDLDRDITPDQVILPISADSSQLEAIWEASEGKNFILHGPPGTGKSQTITNLIANALYKGKRVLFVAEKMAALSVVQRRLDSIGLAPFCLELHSNKVKKGAVLSQLKATTEVVKTNPPENFKEESKRIFALRSEMNKYIDALHKVYPFGISMYEAIVKYQQIEAETILNIPPSILSKLDKNILLQWFESIDTLISTARACGHPYNHPLSGISINNYSSAIKDEAAKLISDTINLLAKIKGGLGILLDLFSEFDIYKSKQNTETVITLINKLFMIPELTPALLTAPQLENVFNEYSEVCQHGRKRDELKSKLSEKFSDEILSINANKLLLDWNQASNKWFIPRFFKQRSIRKQLLIHATDEIDKGQIPKILNQIIDYQEENAFIQRYEENLLHYFGKYARNDHKDWTIIEQILEEVYFINSLILNYTKDISKATSIKQKLAIQLTDDIGSFKRIYADDIYKLTSLISELNQNEKLLTNTLGVDDNTLYSQSDNWVESALYQLNRWHENLGKLKDWYQWLLAHRQMENLNIGFIADQYKNENIDTDKLSDIFKKSLYKSIIDYILDEEPSLDLFKGQIFNDTIEKYKQLVADFENLTRKEVFAQLAANLPSFTREATHNSEVGILQRNIRNNARGISIRRLFDLIPTLLPRMCPCMLMSPISVAQYIDVDADKFDLVVFDEASQMPTYEAVGAIARGKKVVIVGDPKQMPPTNFFSTNTVDEENIEIEDLESILDDCLALSMPEKHLLWHYRSKHESLIAFSNSEYYDNKLLTFPSPDNIESKVKFVPIDGHYDKGKSRQNKYEAQAIVNEITRRLKDKELRKKSIGVVTFSIVQQSLIEDMLSDLFVSDHELEQLAYECEEPLFIKNLENVQGDERDVILFSVGYGPDKNGKVSMNFGPLNRLGGERRLNVAVSRARNEMIIFSTLRSDQIDLNRTSAIGVAGLKRFLEYAEKGSQITNKLQFSPSKDSINLLIAKELAKLGYTVHTNIGSSGYKIDIGIIDNENPAKYRLGIICDGENYTQAKMVRDREIVQNSVLKMLGWKICKVWTLDWLENPEAVINSIQEALNSSDKDINEDQDHKIQNNYLEYTEAQESVYKANDIEELKNDYQVTRLDSSRCFSEEFFFSENRKIILDQIRKIIELEAPISRQLLCKRILSAWGISRLGQRIDSYLEELFNWNKYYTSESEDLKFYWINEAQYNNFDYYRTGERDAIDLPPEEVANAMKYLLTNEISLPITDLLKICAQLFGYARSGSNVEAAMNRGLTKALEKKILKVDSDRAIIL